MKEYLFRGKRADNGELVISDSLMQVKGQYPRLWVEFDGWVEVIPETVGQYTGLTDKNGKKTFEGDICRVVYLDSRCDSNGNHYEVENSLIEEVVLETGAFCFKVTIEDIPFYCPIGFDIYEKQKIKYFEVIGNVYDNPELLEVEE